MAKRAAIARGLAVNSEILLFDEPFGALDAMTKIQMQEEVKKIKKEKNKTMILVTHDIEEALYVCDRILILKGQPANISKKINLASKRKENKLSLEEEVELKREILNSLYEN